MNLFGKWKAWRIANAQRTVDMYFLAFSMATLNKHSREAEEFHQGFEAAKRKLNKLKGTESW